MSECLEAVLVDHGASPLTSSVDLAAREAYGHMMIGRGKIMATLEAMPQGVRKLAIRLPLALQSRRKWRPHYQAGLRGADAAAIGGGNLLADLDLNFPTKLALANDTAAAEGLPVAIYGCGMGAHWTEEGDRRLRRSFTRHRPCAVFLRDQMSQQRWDERFGAATGQEAIVVRDPGLLASEVYGQVPRPKADKPRIGLGIMSHVAIRYHADSRQTEEDLLRWYVDLATALSIAGAEVVCFTNGAPEDVATAQALKPELEKLATPAAVLTPKTPAELAAVIAGFDAIAAYRMHAVIAAYSFGVPVLALSWDSKLQAFMDSVSLADSLRDPADLPPAEAARFLLDAAAQGADEAARKAVLAEARADVGKLYQALTQAL